MPHELQSQRQQQGLPYGGLPLMTNYVRTAAVQLLFRITITFQRKIHSCSKNTLSFRAELNSTKYMQKHQDLSID